MLKKDTLTAREIVEIDTALETEVDEETFDRITNKVRTVNEFAEEAASEEGVQDSGNRLDKLEKQKGSPSLGDDMRFIARNVYPLIKSSVELNNWIQRVVYHLQTGKFHSDLSQERLDVLVRQLETARAEVKSVANQLSHFEVWD